MTGGTAGRRAGGKRAATLWSAGPALDARMLAYTIGDDRHWDTRLLRWDVLGSLGHIEGLRAARLLDATDYRALRDGLRAALRAVEAGTLVIGAEHEDAHSAVELWLTRRLGAAGERLHTGRSRNDQVACDLRLQLKDALLALHEAGLAVVEALTAFAATHRTVLWPGYTHQRRAMPSSAGLWAAALAEGLLDTLESLPALWARVDRSPLGSAAGYGAPLPLEREVVARALGFARVEHNVAAVQNGRGKLEGAVLFWCTELAHELAKLSADALLWSAEEFGWLVLPPELATGSSIMPHKRNPDLFELTRARAAALQGDLATAQHLAAKLGSGYHRDFQLLKEPLFRGLDRTAEMLGMMAVAVPRLGVDRARAAAALAGGALATDEVMRRVEAGVPFRRAYREVAEGVKRGETFPAPGAAELVARRRSTGGLGRLGLDAVRARITACRRWSAAERRRFDGAMRRLAGTTARDPSRGRKETR
ncbi:MAG TPA: lyase family protein [Gemmatimonadales bacterium]|nr:lyase family protein [Gemmatimonadales bacterium]